MIKSIFFSVCLSVPLFAVAQVSVLTQHNDLARTGENLYETQLTVANVNQDNFGKIFNRDVDDQIYTQPLVVCKVDIPVVGKRNVVYVATVNNTVYAFDAEDATVTAPYWQKNFTPSGATVVKNTDMTGACGGNYLDFSGNMGIVGTPVIDTVLKTIYFVSRDKVTSNGDFEQWLHALDITDGSEKPLSPVLINAKYSGSGDGSVNDTITFESQKQNQRPALSLVNGIVYIAWSSHCDWGPYHGWVIGYDAATLEQKCVWMDTPDGINGGIWMSGQAISADDDGNLYLSTGNGTVGENGDPSAIINRGESFLKLHPQGNTLQLLSFFTSENYEYLETYDIDLGSQGLLLVPETNWAIGGGKEGKVYLVDRDSMGGVDSGVNHVVQEFSVGNNNQLHGGCVYWHSDVADYIYLWPSNQHLRAYRINYTTQQLDQPQAMQSAASSTNGQPGGMLSISANGSTQGSAILWAALPLSGNANQETRPGILRAYDAADLSHELWNSQMNAANDSIEAFAKFVCPTVANGKVYLATFAGQLQVYGLLNTIGISNVISDENSWTIYPNPAKQQITISGLHKTSSASLIVISDVTGKEFYRTTLNDLAITIDVHTFQSGIYFMNVNGNIRMFVKQ